MILIGKNCVLLDSGQEFIELKPRLLLTFFICLHNQTSSPHFIVTYERVQIFKEDDLSNRRKIDGCSIKICVGFCLTQSRMEGGCKKATYHICNFS